MLAYSVRSGETTDFDVIVIGRGTGNTVAGAAAGLETALVEPGPLGWTCLDRAATPRKY